MEEVNKELIKYIEDEVLPQYDKNDKGHGLSHIKYVIERCFKLLKQFSNINKDMIYAIAAFHDIAHHIDKDNHEFLSAEIFYENEKMQEFFTDEQRIIIKEAIEDHRASLEYVPRSDYGKIISTADRNVDVATSLKRTHAYTIKNFKNLDTNKIIERAYKHIKEKFGNNGYAKIYCKDEEFDKFKEEIKELLEDKEKFISTYLEVNEILDKAI